MVALRAGVENVTYMTMDEEEEFMACSDEEFDRHVRRCIEVMTSATRYVLGVADQVVPDSSERRIRRVRELADQYGHYR